MRRLHSVRSIYLLMFILMLPISNGLAEELTQRQHDIETVGDVLQVALPATAYAMTFALDDSQGNKELPVSFVANLAITHGLKLAIDKPRPNGSDNNSFPSGHTSASFQGAAFIHKRYGLGYGSIAYAAASFVGYSRVQANKHYWEDVFAGAAIGIGTTWLLTSRPNGGVHHKGDCSECPSDNHSSIDSFGAKTISQQPGIGFYPVATNDGLGIGTSFSW